MRHRKKSNQMGRKAAHRKETLSSLATALILNKRIHTTVAKAKALRIYVEPLITRSKEDTTHSRRMVFSHLGNKHAVSELFREIAQKVAERPGGYTRILKTGFRKGDGADMCFIELVDYNTNMLAASEDAQQKKTRRGRRRKKAEGQDQASPSETTQVAGQDGADEAPEAAPELTTEEESPSGEEAVAQEAVKDEPAAAADVEGGDAEKEAPAGEAEPVSEEKPAAEKEEASKKAEKKEKAEKEEEEKPEAGEEEDKDKDKDKDSKTE